MDTMVDVGPGWSRQKLGSLCLPRGSFPTAFLELEWKQLGFKPVSDWDVGAAGTGVTGSAMLAL